MPSNCLMRDKLRADRCALGHGNRQVQDLLERGGTEQCAASRAQIGQCAPANSPQPEVGGDDDQDAGQKIPQHFGRTRTDHLVVHIHDKQGYGQGEEIDDECHRQQRDEQAPETVDHDRHPPALKDLFLVSLDIDFGEQECLTGAVVRVDDLILQSLGVKDMHAFFATLEYDKDIPVGLS